MASINDGSRSPERVSAPWSKIVSGESSELPPPVVSVTSPATSPPSIEEQIMNASTDWDTADESEGSVKKAVWSKPSNGVVEAVSPVMGAVSWPALGESTKAAVKSSSFESLQSLSDGSSVPAVQVTGNLSALSHKPPPNHVTHSGVKRDSNGGFTKTESLGNASDAVAMDSIPKQSSRGGFGSQGNDNQQQNSHRRGNGGPYSRGEGSYNHNFGQSQGRGNQQWSQHRNFNNMQPQRGGFRRGRPSSTPFIHPRPMPPFANNVMYPDPMIYFQGAVPPMVPGPRYFAYPDPLLHANIVKQIEYYFSNENLVKDTYLRRNMDEQGWVLVNLIAGFKKVSSLTDNVQLILDVMRQSTVVEVQGEKMRRRNEWMKWLMPPAVEDSLASQLQGMGLDSRGGGERAAVA